MTLRDRLAGAAPYLPALLLVAAAGAGGLRSPGEKIFFGALCLAWAALRPGALSFSGQSLPALFFAWCGLAAAFSPEPAVSLGAAGGLLLAAFFYFSAASGEGRKSWLPAVYALGGFSAALLLAQRLGMHRAIGFVGANPNYSAAFCAAAFAPAALALSGAASRRERLLFGALAALLAAGLLASGSRGGLLAALLAAAAGFAAAGRWRWLAGLGLLCAAAAALVPYPAWEALLKLHDPRAFARPRLWGAALEAAAASPLLGWGPGRFDAAFELFKFPFESFYSYYAHSTPHAHGEVFNLAAEAGFPAAVLFLGAAGKALYDGRGERLPCALAALAVLLQGSFDMVFWSGAVTLLFWGSLGCCVPAGPAAGVSARPALAAAALLCLAAPFAAGGQRAFAELQRAEGARSPVIALARARAAAAASPKSAFARADQGYALAAAGDPDGAAAAFAGALELEPNFAAARLALAGALSAAGKKTEACAALGGLPPPAPGTVRNAYDRALVLYDRAFAARLEKDLCGKRKTGAATATSRKKR